MSREVLALALVAGLAATSMAGAAERYGFGRTPTPEELAGWDIDVRADGAGLPAGQGSVMQGRQLYAELCAGCHGEKGEGKPMDRLAGGFGTLTSDKPVTTVGSYWPYATTLFDYIRRAMPFNAPQSLTPDQVYAVSAYVLHLNGVVPEDAVLDQTNLANVQMPNRNGFISPDPRPDVENRPCMESCR